MSESTLDPEVKARLQDPTLDPDVRGRLYDQTAAQPPSERWSLGAGGADDWITPAEADDWVTPPEPLRSGDLQGVPNVPGLRNVVGAIGRGAAEGFGSEPLGLSGQNRQTLRDWGIFPSAPGAVEPLRMANQTLIEPLVSAADFAKRGLGAIFRGGQAGVAQIGTELGNPQAGRDIAAIPEAFLGQPFGLGGRPAVPPTGRGGAGRPGVPPDASFFDGGMPPEGPPGTGGPALPAPPLALTGPRTGPLPTTWGEVLQGGVEGPRPPAGEPPPAAPPSTPPSSSPAAPARPAGPVATAEPVAPPVAPPVETPPNPAQVALQNHKTSLAEVMADPRTNEEIAQAWQAERVAAIEQARAALPPGFVIDQRGDEWVLVDPNGEIQASVLGQPPSVETTQGWVDDANHLNSTFDYSDALRQGQGTRNDPVVVQQPNDIAAATQHVAAPTPGQAEAENHQMGHVQIGPLRISITTPAGQERIGVGPDGTPWSVNMPADYGRLKGTIGADGDHVDVYLGPNAHEAQKHPVFVIDQIDPRTGAFDEHKSMLGFPSLQAAQHAYEAAFNDGSGPSRVGAIRSMTFPEFVAWTKKGNTKAPLAYQAPAEPPLIVAKQRQLYGRPLSLIEFLAASGGIKDQGGELASIGLTKKFVPKIGMLVRPNGRSLDYARELAQEAGYLKAESANQTAQVDVADLLNLLAEEAAGRPVFTLDAQADMDAQRQAQAEAIYQLRYDEARALLDDALDGSPLDLTADQLHRATQAMLDGWSTREAVAIALIAEHEALDADLSAEADRAYIQAVADALEINADLAAQAEPGSGWDIPFDWSAEDGSGRSPGPSGGAGAEPPPESPAATGADTGPAQQGESGSEPVGSSASDQVPAGGAGPAPAGDRPTERQPEPARPVEAEPERDAGRDTAGSTEGTGSAVQGPEQQRNDAGEQAAEADTGSASLAEAFRDAFLAGRSFPSIQQARAFAAQKLGKPVQPGTMEAKTVDEAIELGVVLAGREIASSDDPAAVFDRLLQLYEQQPKLGVRTSGSVERQAYSTPIPLAYAAGRMGGITRQTGFVYEPTAGNGALVVGADTDAVVANEIDPDRRAQLEAQGFRGVTGQDATQPLQKEMQGVAQVVIANPPFGAVKGDDGKTVRFDMGFIQPGYTTGEIDHAIALRALEAMKPDGRAVLILGGVNKLSRTPKARADAYNGKAKREFFLTLYAKYNVVDHFTVPGELYEKQGAGWPVDIIVIDGRGKSALPLPAVQAPRIVPTWDGIKEVMLNGQPAATAAVAAGAGPTPGMGAGGQPGSNSGAAEEAGSGGPDVQEPVLQPTGASGPMDGGPGGGSAGSPAATGGQPGASRPSGSGNAGSSGKRPSDAGNAGGEPSVSEPTPVDSGPAVEPVASAPDGVGSVSSPGDNAGGLDGSGDSKPASRPGVASSTPATAPRAAVETEKPQSPYTPASTVGRPVGTLVPTNLASVTQQALDALAQRTANQPGGESLDTFVADRLGYTTEELEDYFSAEQIDAIALGIDQIDKGQGFVIGDQTGVGKGRVVAAMIRYAERAGLVPIFVTEKSNLFADMARDLTDIGMPDMVEWILATNNNLKLALTDDPDGPTLRTGTTAANEALLAKVAQQVATTGKLPDEYRVVMTTYTQLQTVRGAKTARMNMAERLAPNAFLILDEAHNAGGSGGAPEEKVTKKGKLVLPRSLFFRQLVKAARSTFFSSATWAKRPDVMDLYGAKTAMRDAVENLSLLADAIKNGGVPMQQIVTAQLAQMGQYIRRERSFDGVTYDLVTLPVDRKAYNDIAGILAGIFSVSQDYVKPVIQGIFDNIRGGGGGLGGDNAVGEAGASSTSFGAVMHNVINQMLLATKTPATIDRAIAKLKEGKKPVITVANTMGSFIKEFAEDNNAKSGDALGLTFNALLLRYLKRTLRWVEKEPFSDEKGIEHWLDPSDLGPEGERLYRDLERRIAALDLSSLPVSPIDYMRAKLVEAGYKVGEITGRTEATDYRANGRVHYRVRPTKETMPAGRQDTIRAFNRGDLDVLILNQSGATGLSIHASEKFKDQKKRSMLIAQPEANIDTHMQMLGRVHRTGQVIEPEYEQLIADIPAEKRPAAVLAKKMASLNASTTSSRKAVVGASNTPDFINKYGGLVVRALLDEIEDLEQKLGFPLGVGDDPETTARKVTGRIPLLNLDDQESVYTEIETRYRALIEELDAAGENGLEAKTLDLDARQIKAQEFIPAKGDERNPFAAAARLELMDVKRTTKPPKPEVVVQDLARGLKVPNISAENMQGRTPDDLSQTIDHISANDGEPVVESLIAQADAAFTKQEGRSFKDPDARQRYIEKLGAARERVMAFLRMSVPGTLVDVASGSDLLPARALVLNIELKGKTATAPSNYELTILTDDGVRRRIPGSNLYTPENRPQSDMPDGARILSPVSDERAMPTYLAGLSDLGKRAREERWIITGNILAAYAKQAGQIVNFTDENGVINQGILLARDFDPVKAQAKVAQQFSAQQAHAFLRSSSDLPWIETSDKALRVARDTVGNFIITAPSSKKDGGAYFLDRGLRRRVGDFVKAGDKMRAKTTTYDLPYVLDEIERIAQANGQSFVSGHPQAKQWASEARFLHGAAPELADGPPAPPEAHAAAVEAVRKIVGPQGAVETNGAPLPNDVAGMAIGGLVRVSTAGPVEKVAWALHHEAIHALRNLGLFSAGEWKTLVAAVERQGWIERFDIANRYPNLSREKQIEEAIAEAFAAAATNPDLAPKGVIGRAWGKVRRFLGAFRNALAGLGFRTAAGVFEQAQAGRIGQRIEPRLDRRGPLTLDEARERADRLTVLDQDGNEVDLMAGMSDELKRRIREGARNARNSASRIVTNLWGGTKVPDGVEVIAPELVRDINPITRWFKTPEYLFKGTELAPVIQAGIRAEEKQSLWIGRLTAQYADIRQALKKAGGDFDKVSEALFVGDADQVDVKDDAARQDLFDAWNLTDAEAKAFMDVHRLLDTQARLVDNHRRAMLPNVRAQKQAAIEALERFLNSRKVSGTAARRLYRERAVLTKRISDGSTPDLEADSKRVDEINAELRRMRAADPDNAETLAELQETIDGLEARLNATGVRGRIKGYVPHKFYGSWRLWEVTPPDDAEEGSEETLKEITSEQGFYNTREEALRAAEAYLKDHPGVTLRIAPKAIHWPAGIEGTQVSDAAYRRLAANLADKVGVEGPALTELLQGVARRRNRRRIYAPGLFRSGADGYSKNMDRIMRTHIGQSVRYVTMDRLKYQAITTAERAGLSPYRTITQERPELQKAFEAWFRDVNGGKQSFEEMMDRALTRLPVPFPVMAAAAAGFAAMGGASSPVMASALAGYLGYRTYRAITGKRAPWMQPDRFTDFPTRSLISSMASDMGHLKLGLMLNLKSALVNLTQIALNTYPTLGAKWTGRGIVRGSKAVWDATLGRDTPDTKLLRRADIQSLYRIGETGPVLAEQEGRLAKMSMFWFQSAETMNRAVTFFAALERAESHGKSHADAMAEARMVTRRTQFHMGNANKPELLRQQWARLPAQFKNFMAQQIAFVFGYLRHDMKGIARFAASMFVLAGLVGTAGMQLLDLVTETLSGFSPVKAVERMVLEAHAWGNVPGNAATMFAHGLPASFVDLSQSVGMGSGFLPGKAQDMAGPWWNTLQQQKQAAAVSAGIVDRLALASPSWNWLKSLEAAADGRQITSAGFWDPAVWGNGVSAWTDWRHKNATLYRPTNAQLIAKAMNFTPAGETLLRSMIRNEADVKAERAKKAQDVLSQIVQAAREGRNKDIGAMVQQARKDGLPLTQEQIAQAVKDGNKTAIERLQKQSPKVDRPAIFRQGEGVKRQLGQ